MHNDSGNHPQLLYGIAFQKMTLTTVPQMEIWRLLGKFNQY